ncbi:hematopoietic SH2 domain-containing protein homolog [Pholidichthys leucotaenia]
MMEGCESLHKPQDALTWFKKSQLQSVIRNGVVPEWFHGIISRKAAEELLCSKPPGYFLIRVSESRIGYTLSYRDVDRCKHFMIDALEDGHYIIVGESRHHRCLQDLVDFHRRTPILPFCQVLTVACGQLSNDKTDYAELLFSQRGPGFNTILPPDNFLPPCTNQPVSPDDIPPALPYRPKSLMISTVPSSTSQLNKLYPSLECEFQHVPSTPPAMPVPKARKIYTADNSPSIQSPKVPSRSFAPTKLTEASITEVSNSLPTSAASDHQSCTNIQPVKNQEAKQSVVTNLKNLKKKFHKKISSSEENTYAEITDISGNTEHEYQEISLPFSGSPAFSTNANLAAEELPQEYLPPPPFAPGY